MILAWFAACGSPEPALAPEAEAALREPPVERDLPVEGVSGAASAAGRTVLARWRPGQAGSELVVVERGEERILVDASWNADRPAISPDGGRVAFVSGRTGIASVWVVPSSGGEPEQVTNVGLVRRKGEVGAPAGFVPPPVDDSLRFQGAALVWNGPDGERRAVPR